VAAGLERLHHPALVESVHPDLHLQELPQPVVAFRQMVALVPGEEEDRFVPPPLVQVQGLLGQKVEGRLHPLARVLTCPRVDPRPGVHRVLRLHAREPLRPLPPNRAYA
jgi:hypothetical protein